MPEHALLEITVEPGQHDQVLEAVSSFVDTVRDRETRTRTVEAFAIEGTRTVLVHLVFEDALAARDHREAKHTRAFTDEIADVAEAIDVHELAIIG